MSCLSGGQSGPHKFQLVQPCAVSEYTYPDFKILADIPEQAALGLRRERRKPMQIENSTIIDRPTSEFMLISEQ